MGISIDQNLANLGIAPEYTAAVRDMAVQDADAVAQFLDRVLPRVEFPSDRMPTEFYLRLAVFLRLARWEQIGISRSVASDLPTSRDVLGQLIQEMEAGSFDDRAAALQGRLLMVVKDTMLWDSTDSAMRLKTAVSVAIDNDVLDKIAEFLLQQLSEG